MHAVRSLRTKSQSVSELEARERRYGAAIKDAMVALWKASDRVSGKRLKPIISVPLPTLVRHSRLNPDARGWSSVSSGERGKDQANACGFKNRGGWWPAATRRVLLGNAADEGSAHSWTFLSRNAFPITLTDDNAMAPAAIIGESVMPNQGYRTPAATGTPTAL